MPWWMQAISWVIAGVCVIIGATIIVLNLVRTGEWEAMMDDAERRDQDS